MTPQNKRAHHAARLAVGTGAEDSVVTQQCTYMYVCVYRNRKKKKTRAHSLVEGI